MKVLVLGFAFLGAVLAGAAIAGAQSPSPTPAASPTAGGATPTASATPPVTSVPQFSSEPHYLRAWPGPEEDSWYVYASGFAPGVEWVLGEVLCPGPPCNSLSAAVNDLVKADGTMTFYLTLPPAAHATRPRMLGLAEYHVTAPLPDELAVNVPVGAPTIEVANRNPGVGLGYPAGTRTGVAPVDQVVALVEAHDTAAVRSRLVFKSGTTASGEPVRGVASWQCQPYFQREGNLDQIFEYPAGRIYAAFRIPADPELPLRYEGAAYGIAFYDGGQGIPLGGLILVSASGQIVGTEIRCGTTPGYHVHNFTDFILAPYVAPPATATPGPPSTGNAAKADGGGAPPIWALAALVLLLGSSLAAGAASRGRRS